MARTRRTAVPDFLIIGAQRCGTTALYKALTDARDIAAARQKEIHYFDWQYANGDDSYLYQFPALGHPDVVTGEASPYYIYHPLVPERVHALLPDIKIIALLRNPVDRAYSNYWFEVHGGFETLAFEQAIEEEPARLTSSGDPWRDDPFGRHFAHEHQAYLARGRYAEQLERWLQYFDRSQLLIIVSERLFADSIAAVGDAREFLGLPRRVPGPRREVASRPEHENAQEYEPMSPQTRQRLIDHFHPHNCRLYELCGEDLGWDQ